MDEPERDGPQQPGTGQPADPDPPPPARAHLLRGALVSRAAGWVVAVALAGAVVALSVVLATTPQGLQVAALAGPGTITAIPAPEAVTGPGRAQVHAVLPAQVRRAICVIHSGPGSFRVVLPARPGQVITIKPSPVTVKPGVIVVPPGAVRLVPAVGCPPR